MTVDVERIGRVQVISIQREEKRNALNAAITDGAGREDPLHAVKRERVDLGIEHGAAELLQGRRHFRGGNGFRFSRCQTHCPRSRRKL